MCPVPRVDRPLRPLRTSAVFPAVVLLLSILPQAAPRAAEADDSPGDRFLNPIAEGADPWVVRYGDSYYWCQSEGNRGVSVWRTDRLTNLGERHAVWHAPDSGPHSAEIWAPELHFLDGRWYVYVAASDGHNENHRTIVLESAGGDPLGEYRYKAELYTGDEIETGRNNRWAIDATVLEYEGKRYVVWSGWEDDRDEQWLYIAPMENPWTVGGNRVRLCDNDDYLWERVKESAEERGLHEAPEVLMKGGRTFLVYSCSGSWEPTYKLGMLELRPGGDPLNPDDWSKRAEPVFRPTREIFGTGHCAFVKSPDGADDWLVYHSKVDRRPGWRRAIRIQPFHWSAAGEPEFGGPAPPGRPLPVPSGQTADAVTGTFHEDFDAGLGRWSYYGHQQYFGLSDGRLHLGLEPGMPINEYRCGEKVVVRDGTWQDFTTSVKVTIHDGGRDAGLLFRVNDPSLGYDAQKGYFFGLLPDEDRAVLGYTDGARWHELGRAEAPVEPDRPYELSVRARGEEIAVSLDSKELIRIRDGRSRSGTVGLRVVDVHAAFDDFVIGPLAD